MSVINYKLTVTNKFNNSLHSEQTDDNEQCYTEDNSDEDDTGLIDTRERESEAIQLLRDDAAVNDITITDQPSDNFEEQAISEFILSGCGCSKGLGKGLGKPCCQQFPDDYIHTYR